MLTGSDRMELSDMSSEKSLSEKRNLRKKENNLKISRLGKADSTFLFSFKWIKTKFIHIKKISENIKRKKIGNEND